MLLTIPLLNKGSFLGSLINICRQVIRIKPVNKLETNIQNPNISTSITTPTLTNTTQTPSVPSNLKSIRPPAVRNLSLSKHSYTTKNYEEKVGLPPRPKKPLTPYFRYMNETRPKLIVESPKLPMIEIVKKVSKQWENLDASKKQRLQEEYQKEREKYIDLRAKYDAKVTDEQRLQIKDLKREHANAKEKRMMRKRVKAMAKPKKPASAFLRFISKERTLTPQMANETFREWHQKATARWGSLTDEQKNVYMVEARKELEIYKKDLSLWEEKMIRLGQIDLVRVGKLIDPPEPKPKRI